MAERVAAVAVKYVIDQATVQAAERSAETVQASLQQINVPLGGLGVAAQNSVDRIQSEFRSLDRQFDLTEQQIRDIRDDLESLDDVVVQPQIRPEETVTPPTTRRRQPPDPGDDTERRRTESYGDVSTSFGAVASVLGAGGGNVESLRFIGDATGFLEYYPRFVRGLSEIGEQLTSTGSVTTRIVNGLTGVLGAGAAKAAVSIASLGAFGAALTVLAVITDQFARQSEDNKRRLQSALDAQNAYYNALGDNQTIEQVTGEVERLQARQAALAQQIAETSSAQESAFAQTSASFGDLGARLLDNQSGVGQFRGQLETLRQEFDTNQNTIARYEAGLEAGRFATEEAIDAERQLADERRAFAQETRDDAEEQTRFYERALGLRRQAQTDPEGALESVEALQQAARDRFQALDRTIEEIEAAYNQAIDSNAPEAELQGYEEVLADLRSQRGALRRELDELRGLSAEFYQLSLQVFDNQIGSILDNLIADLQSFAGNRLPDDIKLGGPAPNDDDIDDKGFDGSAKFAAAYAEAVRNTASSLEAAERAQDAYDTAVENAAAKLTDAQAQIEDRLTDADANDAQAREEAAIKLGRDLAEAEREYGEQRLAITRRYNATAANAIASRDALALILARRNRDQELEQAEAQDEARRGNIERAYQQQETDLTRNLERQRQQITNDGNARLAQLRAQGNAEIQARAQTLSRANADLANAQAQERALRVQAIATTNQIVAGGLATTTNHFRTAIDQINAYASKLGTGAGKGVGSGLSGGIGGTGYLPAAASTIPPSMPPQQQTINNIVVNTATNRREVTALSNSQARRVLGQYLED